MPIATAIQPALNYLVNVLGSLIAILRCKHNCNTPQKEGLKEIRKIVLQHNVVIYQKKIMYTLLFNAIAAITRPSVIYDELMFVYASRSNLLLHLNTHNSQ